MKMIEKDQNDRERKKERKKKVLDKGNEMFCSVVLFDRKRPKVRKCSRTSLRRFYRFLAR